MEAVDALDACAAMFESWRRLQDHAKDEDAIWDATAADWPCGCHLYSSSGEFDPCDERERLRSDYDQKFATAGAMMKEWKR